MFQENIKKIEIKNTLSTTNKKVILLMFLTNTTSAWAHQQSKLTASKQATSKRASSSSSSCNQTLSPPEGILEAKVSNPQKMCRIEMTCEDRSGPAGAVAPPPRIVCGDHFDPEVGTWDMDDPPSPLETSP